MQVHGTCAARDDAGVLLLGPPGSGKSDLALRLIARGWSLVADDVVEIEDGVARAPAALAGLLEVRGLGVMRVPHRERSALALMVEVDGQGERLPAPRRDAGWGLPIVIVDARAASAPERVEAALDCALGRVAQVAGAFA